jgi:hypothetical protein
MKKEFDVFKEEFNKWYKKFELSQFRIYFEEDKKQTPHAEIFTYHEDGYALVKFNPDADSTFINPKYSAKHEAIHLLISDLSDLASSRYITSSELVEAEEKLVNKLEKLIQ